MSTKRIGTREIEKEFGPLTFAILLKSYRLGEEMSQVEFSKLLGLSKQSLNDLENGRKSPSIRRAIGIAKKISLLPDLVVQVVLQDQVNKEKLKLSVSVKSLENLKKAS
jgi:DNA-binding XRE family transcriptional regulator